MADNSYSAPESYPMIGGDGKFSYNKNSYFQRKSTNAVKEIIDETIADKLDIKEFSPTITTFTIADMGCSVGPNTFITVQNIVEAVRCKYTSQGLTSQIPDFQVYFNDHVSNDFNTLFASLPSDRPYYAAGVPGSFYTRLFPESSLHFVHSSYALQWLSKVPEPVLDRSSPAWNKGRVHYTDAPDEVSEAYRLQFIQDMEVFLSARSKEIVRGGLMVLIMPGIQDGVSHSQMTSGLMFELLGLSLMDMVKEGKISEDKVDSFNLPVYAASPGDMAKLVGANGCFTIERMELTLPGLKTGVVVTGEALTLHLRAGMEGVISKHFGSDIIDELFDRYLKKAEELQNLADSTSKKSYQLLVILKRI